MVGLGETWALVFSLPLVLVWDSNCGSHQKGKDKKADKSQNSTFVDLDYTMTLNQFSVLFLLAVVMETYLKNYLDLLFIQH